MDIIKVALPNSGFPKPGERVTWFSRNQKITGSLVGYDIDEKPQIINEFGNPDSTISFDVIRPVNPNDRIGPNWQRMPTEGKIEKATDYFKHLVEQKLNEFIPPGPCYMDLISEMYYRGYETYLVGGTVRDFLQGEKSNDIDLVTTMPLRSAIPLIESMFNDKYSYKKENGYVRIGGKPSSGDPFIDVKNFTHQGSAQGHSIFGCEFIHDFKVRDFACNAIYYDPINENLIDPSGTGLEDVKTRTLRIVKDAAYHSPYSGAQMLIRYIKFSIRGYSASTETIDIMNSQFRPLFATMSMQQRMSYIRSQILNKHPKAQHRQAYEIFVRMMHDLGYEEVYEVYIKPYEIDLRLD